MQGRSVCTQCYLVRASSVCGAGGGGCLLAACHRCISRRLAGDAPGLVSQQPSQHLDNLRKAWPFGGILQTSSTNVSFTLSIFKSGRKQPCPCCNRMHASAFAGSHHGSDLFPAVVHELDVLIHPREQSRWAVLHLWYLRPLLPVSHHGHHLQPNSSINISLHPPSACNQCSLSKPSHLDLYACLEAQQMVHTCQGPYSCHGTRQVMNSHSMMPKE